MELGAVGMGNGRTEGELPEQAVVDGLWFSNAIPSLRVLGETDPYARCRVWVFGKESILGRARAFRWRAPHKCDANPRNSGPLPPEHTRKASMISQADVVSGLPHVWVVSPDRCGEVTIFETVNDETCWLRNDEFQQYFDAGRAYMTSALAETVVIGSGHQEKVTTRAQ